MTGNPRKEPSLNDLLNDPIIQLVMRRDAVERETIEALIARLRMSRRAGADRMAA